MAFSRVVFPLLVLSVVSCYASKVPVYLWGELPKSSVRANPVTTYSTAEFAATLKQELADDPLTIAFIDETLSVEDFSLKNDDGETAFPYLHAHIGKAIYLPTVDDPVGALNLTADPRASDHIELTENGLSEEIAPSSSSKGRFVFINLKDAREGESRFDLLKRHDQFMKETLAGLSKDVVAIYTAKNPSWTIPVTKSRVRRQAATNAHRYNLDNLLLAASKINLISGNDTRVLSALTSSSSNTSWPTLNATLVFDNTSITLNFNEKGGYWFFNTVGLTVGALSEELYPNEEVFALSDFSYRCAEHVSFTSINETRTYTIRFDDLKIQPFFETTNASKVFGDSFNCIGFFTAPIWSALFVVFILLSITFYGIMMMLDIRTMDRFDDPKGKTITINAAE